MSDCNIPYEFGSALLFVGDVIEVKVRYVDSSGLREDWYPARVVGSVSHNKLTFELVDLKNFTGLISTLTVLMSRPSLEYAPGWFRMASSKEEI